MERILINNEGPYDGLLDIDTDLIDVSTLGSGSMQLDPKWFDVDVNNHFHAYSNYDKDNPLPTLKIETEEREYWCSDCLDHHKEITTSYHCVICEVVVTPKKILKIEPSIRYIQGRTTVTLVLNAFVSLHRDIPVTFQFNPYFGVARLQDYKRNGKATRTILRCDVLGRKTTT